MVEQNTQQTAHTNEFEQNLPEGVKPAIDTVLKYKTQVIIGLAAVLAVVALWTGIRWYNAHAMAKVQNQLGEILLSASGEERITKLEKLAESAPADAAPAVLFELATLCLDEKKYDKAVEYYGELAGDTDGDTRIVARLGKTKALMLAGKPGEAVTILKDVTAFLDKETASLQENDPAKKKMVALIVPANRQLSVAAEQAGDTAAAIAALEKLQETGSTDKQFVEYKLNQLKNK